MVPVRGACQAPAGDKAKLYKVNGSRASKPLKVVMKQLMLTIPAPERSARRKEGSRFYFKVIQVLQLQETRTSPSSPASYKDGVHGVFEELGLKPPGILNICIWAPMLLSSFARPTPICMDRAVLFPD